MASLEVELEVDGLDQLDQALALIGEGLAPDVVMLDNFSLDDLREGVHRTAGRITLEDTGTALLNNQSVRDAYLGSARKRKWKVEQEN